MFRLSTRSRLLGTAVLGAGLATLLPSQASAQCAVSPAAAPVTGPATIACAGTFPTTDTTYAGVTPATDRQYNADTAAGTVAATNTGTVTGAGLAFTNVGAGGNTLSFTNSGSVTQTAASSAGGIATVNMTGVGATSLLYTGSGSIINSGFNAGDALWLTHNGSGSSTATTTGSATITATGPASWAIANFSNGTGAVNVTTSAGTTLRAGATGILTQIGNAASAGNITVVNNGSILSSGAPSTLAIGISGLTTGTGNVTISQNGAVGTAADRVGTGVDGDITNALSVATLRVDGTAGATIFSTGDGINLVHAGAVPLVVPPLPALPNDTGDVLVNYLGSINTTAGDGIDVTANTALVDITAGAITASSVAAGQGVGIRVNKTGAGQTNVNAQGSITSGNQAILVNSVGAKFIGIAAGATVNNTTVGGNDIQVSGAGATTIANAGTIGSAGQTSNAIFTTALTDGAVTVNNLAAGIIYGNVNLTDNADTITNQGRWDLTGSSFLQAGNDTVSNTGTLNLNGVLDGGAGTDAFTNGPGGTVNVLGNSSIINFENVSNANFFNLNNFTLTGNGVFTNAVGGLLDTSGNASLIGFTTLNNAGVIDLAAGVFTVPAIAFTQTNTGIVRADEGATTITGQTSFSGGTLDLQDGVVNDNLTINSNYVGGSGSGARLQVDANLTTADTLIVNGATSGGPVKVDVQLVGGAGLITSDILVVDDTTTTGGVFVLGNVTGVGASDLVDYDISQIGQDYYLTSTFNAAAFDPLFLVSAGGEFWHTSANEVFAQTRLPNMLVGLGFWGQVYGSVVKHGDSDEITIDGVDYDVNTRVKARNIGFQAGADYNFGMGRVGLTGGYMRTGANGDQEFIAQGWNVGVYGSFGGPIGFHGAGLFKYDDYKTSITTGYFEGFKTDMQSTGVDGSLGYRFGDPDGMIFDVAAGLSHVWTSIDDLVDVDNTGFSYDYDRLTSTRGRIGARAYFGGSTLRPYIDVTAYREFDGDGEVILNDTLNPYVLETDGRETWVRGELGLVGANFAGPMLALWGELGDRKGVGARIGFRLGGAPVEAVLPPPPPPVVVAPPPPPPPATQTCPDGSVILATDACPPPPPPPPPVAEPERG